jgi:putative CocE/NonD family hydrolase
MGLAQWKAAQTGSPYLKAIIPQMAPADEYLYGMNGFGGASHLYINLPWALGLRGIKMTEDRDRAFRHLPILTADEFASGGRVVPFYRDWIRHPNYDHFWKSVSNHGHFQQMDLPILQICGWWDIHVVSLFANYQGIERHGTPKARRLQKVVVGPWIHTTNPQRTAGVLDFGEDSVVDHYALWLRWMDRYLKGRENGVEAEPPLKLFVVGRNEWRTAQQWPPRSTKFTPFYLHSQGDANTLAGDGLLDRRPPAEEPSDHFVYDPENPVPTITGVSDGTHPPQDHREIERRPDVLVYTGQPLARGLEIVGPVRAKIFAATSARDTDWTARLLDVHPDGRALNVCAGVLRARFRNSFEKPELLKPGAVYEFEVSLGVAGHAFLPGHCVRLEISSSNFPRYDRNLNSGGELGIDPTIVVAEQTVYHDQQRASRLVLPVVRPE